MGKISALCFITVACAGLGYAQMGQTTDWWSSGGDAQRSRWEKDEQKFTRDDIKDFQLLWKMKLDNGQKGVHTLLAPVIVGNLIGYRGFKELAFVAGSSGSLWAIDADLERMYWQKHFELSSESSRGHHSSGACSAALTAMPTLTPPVIRFRRPLVPPINASQGAARANLGTAGGPAAPGAPAANAARDALSAQPPGGAPRPGGANPAPGTPPGAAADPYAGMRNLFTPKPVYVLLGDGTLRRLNVADGEDIAPPVNFLPPHAKAQNLNYAENVVYTTTADHCGGAPNAVWAADLSESTPKINSFVQNDTEFQGPAGPALGADGTVYVQTSEGKFDPASNKYGNSLLALSAKELKLKGYFELPESSSPKNAEMNATTPLLFIYKGRELIATAAKDGRLYLLDPKTLGEGDHRSPLYRTPPIAAVNGKSPGQGIWGSLSTWEDIDGTRYVLAAVRGPLESDLKAPITYGDTPNGSIVAFKVQDDDDHPILTPAWVSRDLAAPAPPVIAKGIVFALSNGEFTCKVKKSGSVTTMEEHPKGSTHATLYALDGLTGKEMYSTGDQVTAPGSLTGLSLANGRLYFATIDNTMNVFGKYLDTGRQDTSTRSY